MAIVECPHCYGKVIPINGKFCPACQKDISETDNSKQALAALTVRESSALPAYCYLCNIPTSRSVTINESQNLNSDGMLQKILIFLVASTITFMKMSEGCRSVRIRIPQCHQCAKNGKPKPTQVDFDNLEMTFIVNRNFRDRVKGREPDK